MIICKKAEEENENNTKESEPGRLGIILSSNLKVRGCCIDDDGIWCGSRFSERMRYRGVVEKVRRIGEREETSGTNLRPSSIILRWTA